MKVDHPYIHIPVGEIRTVYLAEQFHPDLVDLAKGYYPQP